MGYSFPCSNLSSRGQRPFGTNLLDVPKFLCFAGYSIDFLHFSRLGPVFALANHSRFVSPLSKNAHSSLAAMSDVDLKGITRKPCNQSTSTTIILFLGDLK